MRAFNRLLLAGTSPLAILIAGASGAWAWDIPVDAQVVVTTSPHTSNSDVTGPASTAGTDGDTATVPHGNSAYTSAAISVEANDAVLNITGGTVTGGTGGKGGNAATGAYNGGDGGDSAGVYVGSDYSGAKINISSGALVQGGTSGNGGDAGGAGGEAGWSGGSVGVDVRGATGTVTNSGTIKGGTAGTDGAANGGTEANPDVTRTAAVVFSGEGAAMDGKLFNNATGKILGNGGYGVVAAAAGVRIENDGEISATAGQSAIYVTSTAAADQDGKSYSPTLVENRGTITGGSGRKAQSETNAGAGVMADSDALAGLSVYNVGTITGGAGGSGYGAGYAVDVQSSNHNTITNFGTLAAGAANGSALPRIALAFDQAGSKVLLDNYQDDALGYFGTIDGGIVASQHGDQMTFYGGKLDGSIYGLAQDASTLKGTGADVSFYTRPTIVTGNIGAAFGTSISAGGNTLYFGPVNTVSLVNGGSIQFTGDTHIHAGDLSFSNSGGLNLGTHKITFHDYYDQLHTNQVTTGTLSYRTTIDATTGKHGYFIYTPGISMADTNMLNFSAQIVPTVVGSVAAGSKYVIIQDTKGREVVQLPSVVNGGGYRWTVASVTGNGETDTDGVNYGTGSTNVVITADKLNAAGSATGTGGAGVRALATYSGNDAGLQALSQAVNNLTNDADIKKAGAQLRPESTVNTAQASMGAVTQALGTIQVRTDAVRVAASEGGSGISSGETLKGLGVWGQVFGATASQDDRGEVSGYDSDTYGLAFGGDFQVLDPLRVGLSFAYAQTNVDSTGDRSGSGQDINSYITSLYSTYSGKGWYVDGALTWGIHKYDATRHVAISGAAAQSLKADYSGQQYGAKMEGGLPLAVGPAVVTPLASLAYNNLHQDAYSESGGSAALRVNSSSTDSIRSGLGAKASAKVATLGNWEVRPNGRAVWYHEFNKSSPEQTSSYVAGGSAFTTPGNDAATEHFNLGLGVDIASVRNTTISAKYDADLADKYVGHSASLQLRTEF